MRLTLDQLKALPEYAGKQKRRDEEGELQAICVAWFRIQPRFRKCQLISIPNEALRSYAVAAKLKRQGMLPGVADLLLLYPNGKHHAAAWLEMKAPGKTQSDSQEAFEANCIELRIPYYVVDSFREFERICSTLVIPENFHAPVDTSADSSRMLAMNAAAYFTDRDWDRPRMSALCDDAGVILQRASKRDPVLRQTLEGLRELVGKLIYLVSR